MSMKIRLNTTDYEIKFRLLRSAVVNFAPRFIVKSTESVAEIMRGIIPVDTGALRDSIRTDIQPLRGEVSTNTGYGLFVDQDTAQHEIRARVGKYLRFEIDGVVFFRKRVVIPAHKGAKFVEQTIGVFRNRWVRLLRDTWNELLG